MSLATILDEFRPGRTIFLPGATGEIVALQDAFAAEPDRLRGVHLVCPMIPGMNGFDYAALHPEARVTTFLMPPQLRPSFQAGRVRVLPIAYSGIARYLAALRIDVALLHLCRAEGRYSFGVAADFGPIVAANAMRRIGVVNAAMPRPFHAPTIGAAMLDRIVEIDRPLATAPPSLETMGVLASRVAELIPDGATLQTGIGGTPGAVWSALTDRRKLRLFSGMIGDGFLAAREAGALAEGGHVAGVAYGGHPLYSALDGSDFVRFADARETHGAPLNGIDRFHAVNSALEVDLLGQANLEWQGGQLISGVGGAPDFARAAQASPGGRAIIALPATARRGSVSRIVARLSAPAPSLGRSESDVVVTEHGAAHLAGLSIDERATALTAIAAPKFRDELAREWSAVRAGL